MFVRISVIIPALNEQGAIRSSVASALDGAGEVIVVDGGSTDDTAGVAARAGARVIESGPGRGAQMDAGAATASGEVLLFLHADTCLPGGWARAVDGAVKGGCVAGAFTLSIDSPGLGLRLVEKVVRLRGALLGLVYGDQAIFATRETFFRAGGFRGLPLMEDVDCVRRLRGLGAFRVLPERVVTSGRRWQGGVVSNSLKNALILAAYRLGTSPETLYRRYYRNHRAERSSDSAKEIEQKGGTL